MLRDAEAAGEGGADGEHQPPADSRSIEARVCAACTGRRSTGSKRRRAQRDGAGHRGLAASMVSASIRGVSRKSFAQSE